MSRAAPLLALAVAVLALLAVLSRISIRTDMAAFLPEGRTEAARLVLDEARSGAATGVILIGVEGAATPELARIAVAMAAALPATGLFALVAGGPAAPDQEFLFQHRYALSPATTGEASTGEASTGEASTGEASTGEAFDVAALRAGLEGVLRQLRSSAAPLAVRYGLADPTGAFVALLRGWATASEVRTVGGAWVAPGGGRALLLARTKAGGMDIPAQETAIGAIEDSFRAAQPAGARLVVAGPAVFARDAARAIRGDVERVSLLSTVLVVALLWWRFRSPLVLAAIAAPVVLSVAAAALAVQAAFGVVHGVALGFGATMLGVSVDYPVLMIGHRKRGEPARDTRARIGRAFIMAVLSALVGLLAMEASGFPGLVQLGVFASAGLASCAVLTWALLPWLVVRADLAPVASGDPAWLDRIEAWRRWRRWALVPIVAAGAYLAIHGTRWEGDLQALSPIPAASLALDRELRGQLGAPEAGQLVLVRGTTQQAVLQAEEAMLPTLDRLREAGAVRGYEAAARLLPSAALQAARAASLPDAATLAARLAEAQAGLPFRADAFRPFQDAVAAARIASPILPADLAGTLLGARLGPLLLPRGGGWAGPIVLSGVQDGAAIAAAVQGSGAVFVDMRAELGGVLAAYTARGWWWLGGSFAIIAAVLAAGLRRGGLVARVMASVAAALLATVALLTLAGVRLSLIHLVALQLVAGVGLDYALFFARRQLDTEERARTLRTLATCNAMTLLTFGALAACQTPLLRDIGVTVAAGALLAMGCAFLFAGEAPDERD